MNEYKKIETEPQIIEYKLVVTSRERELGRSKLGVGN